MPTTNTSFMLGYSHRRDDVMLDLVIHNGVSYHIIVHKNGAVWVNCVAQYRSSTDPDYIVLNAISLWGSNPPYAGLNAQEFINRTLGA